MDQKGERVAARSGSATPNTASTPCSAAAALKLPELFGSEGNGVRGPAFVGALCAAATTYIAVKFLLKYFETNRLTPFGIYCIVAGTICTLIFAI